MLTQTKAPRRETRAPKPPRGGAEDFSSETILHPGRAAVKPLSEHVPIYVRGRVVGYVQDGVFRKKLHGSVHFLRKPRAIAFDISTLHDAANVGATQVEITDAETGKIYQARLDDILRDGRRFNRGHGWQVYYLLSRWRNPDSPEQMTLFDIMQAGETRDRLAAGAGLSQGASPLFSEEVCA